MMSTKQMVLALLVSAQIASAAEVSPSVNVGYIDSFKNICSSISKSGKDVANTCVKAACNNRKAIAAAVIVSGVSAVAYYNWDRVQNAYNKAVAYVKENQEAIVANLKVGGAVLGATGVVTAAGIAIYKKFFAKDNSTEVAAENVSAASKGEADVEKKK